MWQDYRSRDGTRGNRIYGCPFAGRFGCPVKFRIEKLDGAIRLQSSGKHDANSHAVEHVQRGLHHDQRAATVMRQHDQVFEIYQQAPSQIAEEDRAVFCTSHRHCMAEETPLQIFQKSEGVQKFLQASRHAYPLLYGCAEQCPAAQDASLAECTQRIASC